jgi:hypothetical protein
MWDIQILTGTLDIILIQIVAVKYNTVASLEIRYKHHVVNLMGEDNFVESSLVQVLLAQLPIPRFQGDQYIDKFI